jgi:hypothetical protein
MMTKAVGTEHQDLCHAAVPTNRERLAEGLCKFGKVFVQVYGQIEYPSP